MSNSLHINFKKEAFILNWFVDGAISKRGSYLHRVLAVNWNRKYKYMSFKPNIKDCETIFVKLNCFETHFYLLTEKINHTKQQYRNWKQKDKNNSTYILYKTVVHFLVSIYHSCMWDRCLAYPRVCIQGNSGTWPWSCVPDPQTFVSRCVREVGNCDMGLKCDRKQ